MLQKQEIIIKAFKEGTSQRAIAREMRISRKTVKKYIEEYNREKGINLKEGIINPPKYKSTNRPKKVLKEQVIKYIEMCLTENDVKRSQGNFKQCMAGTDIYDGLIERGFTISYPTVIRYLRRQKQKSKEVFIRQIYKPGSSSEFDWGYVKLRIGGVVKSLMLAVFTSAYSNHRWSKLYVRQDMPSFLQSHVEYFELIQGVPIEIVYDNMKTAVAKCTILQSDKKPTVDLLKISTYYQFKYRFANIAKGNEKGHVEKSVEYVRRKAFSPKCEFDSLEQANEYLQNKVLLLNEKSVKGKSISINEQLIEEQKHYSPLPLAPYDYSIINSYMIDKYHTISVDTNHYSVPETIHSSRVNVKVYPDKIHIYDQENETFVIHPRLHAKHQWCISLDHYWLSMVRKPGALHRSIAMEQTSVQIKKLYNEFYQNEPKVFIELMIYCKENDISIEKLKNATTRCVLKCINSPLTSDKIKLVLQSLNTQKPKEPLVSNNIISPTLSETISKHCTEQLTQIQKCFR